MTALLLLSGLAHAHLPHDTVTAVAAPPDLTDDARWWLLSTPNDQPILMTSADAGRTWAMGAAAPTVEGLVGVVRVEDDAGDWIVAAASHTLWVSGDDGSTWHTVATDGQALAVAGGRGLLLGTSTGLYAGAPDALVRQCGGAFPIVAGGAALDAEGDAWVSGPAGWEERASDVPLTAIRGDGAYAGDADGTIRAWDGAAWRPVGALPAPEDPDTQPYADVVALVADGGAMYAASAWKGPYVSTDGGVTWTDLDGPTTTYITGGATDPSEAAPVLLAAGGTLVIGGWAGLARSTDGGASWEDAAVIPADYTRGLAVADDGRVYVAAYGSGVAVTADGGATFRAPSHGLGFENAQRVRTTDTAGALVGVVGHAAVISRDGGEHWKELAVQPFPIVSELYGLGGVRELWAFQQRTGSPSADGMVAVSDDGGQSWSWPAALNALLAGSVPVGLTRQGGTTCVLAEDPVILACGADEDWTVAYAGGGSWAAGPVLDGATRIVVDEAGVHRLDAADTVLPLPGGERVMVLVRADDGRLYAAGFSGTVYESLDGAASWSALGQPGAPVYALATMPRFAANPQLLIGTHDGTFVADRGSGAPIARWGAWQRIDTHSTYWDCTACAGAVNDTAAAMDDLQPLAPGSSLEVWVRGAALTLEGRVDGTATARVRVDGLDAGTLGGGPAALGELWRTDDAAPGWHRVTVSDATGSGIDLDGVTGRDPDTLLPAFEAAPAAPAVDPGCGCGGGDAAGAGLALPLLWVRRRRRPRRR